MKNRYFLRISSCVFLVFSSIVMSSHFLSNPHIDINTCKRHILKMYHVCTSELTINDF